MHDNASAVGRESTRPSGVPSSCPTPHTVALYCGYVFAKFARGQGSGLNGDEVEEITRHMSKCTRCVTMFNAIVDVGRENSDRGAPLWPGLTIALGALATAALALAFMVLAESRTDLGSHLAADRFSSAEVLNIQRPAAAVSQSAPRAARPPQAKARSNAARTSRLSTRVPQPEDHSSQSTGSPIITAAPEPNVEARPPLEGTSMPIPASTAQASAASANIAPDDVLAKPTTVASAGRLTFWRLNSGGVIARSSDGVNWQPLSSGTSSDLLAGAAPSAQICWVVGRGGTVLRTVDGEQWQPTAPPVDADLVAVTAIDEYSATVSTTDGRNFTTHDGGMSWQTSGAQPDRIAGAM